MKKIIIIILSLGIIGCNNHNKSSEIPITKDNSEQNDLLWDSSLPKAAIEIAKANGFVKWNEVAEIAFTFNVDRNGNHSERSWIWKPKTEDIQMISAKDTVNYNRSTMDSLAMKTDAAFINDKYWMLAPFQLIWDKEIRFSEKETVIAPLSKDTLSQLTIVYPNEGGYTPGDAYDFFYDQNFKIKEWNYRKENVSQPSMTTTWEDYKSFDGIDIATMHRDNTGEFKLYFTNISIKKVVEN